MRLRGKQFGQSVMPAPSAAAVVGLGRFDIRLTAPSCVGPRSGRNTGSRRQPINSRASLARSRPRSGCRGNAALRVQGDSPYPNW